MLKRQGNVFRWFVLALGLGYLMVFYQFVQAYKDGLKNNRFEYNEPFVFDTKTGATYIYEDDAIEPQKSVIFTYPIVDIEPLNEPIEEDRLGILEGGRKPKINAEKAKILYDAGGKHFELRTFDEFLREMKHPEKRRTFYDNMTKIFDIGTYEEFESKLIFTDSEQKRAALYEGLFKRKAYTKSYEEFEKQFSDPKSIRKLYDGLKEEGAILTTEFESWSNKYFGDLLDEKD